MLARIPGYQDTRIPGYQDTRILRMATAKNDVIEDIVKDILNNVDRVVRDRGGRTPVQKAVHGAASDIRGGKEVSVVGKKIEKGKFIAVEGKYSI